MGFVYGSTFRLDDTGNVVIEPGGDISLITDYEKIKQDLSVILRSLQGQYIFDSSFGIDYSTYLTNQNGLFFMNRNISDALSKYYMVKNINDISTNVKNGVVTVNADITLKNESNIVINIEV